MKRQTVCEAYEKNVENDWRCRDFVSAVKSYAEGSTQKVLVISGLRGTGKTCGILQAVKDMDAFYYSGQKNDPERFSLKDFEKELHEHKEHVIILDEYPWIKLCMEDGDDLDGFLMTLVENGKRVILSGTEALALERLKAGGLIHRATFVYTNYFSFGEYCHLYGLPYTKENCEKFLVEGGIFPKYVIDNTEGMRAYIKGSIIGSLVSVRPDRYTAEYAEAIVYAVFYQAIRSSLNTSVPVYANNGASFEDLLEEFGINPVLTIAPRDFAEVADILEQTGAIFTVRNYRNRAAFQTYLVNTSLSAQMVKTIYGLTEYPHNFMGYLFEASCAARLYYNRAPGVEAYYVEGRRGGADFQVDFVLQDGYTKQALLFECKLSDNMALPKSASVVSDVVESFFSEGVVGRYVLAPRDPEYGMVNGKEIIYLPPDAGVDFWDFERLRETVVCEKIRENRRADNSNYG